MGLYLLERLLQLQSDEDGQSSQGNWDCATAIHTGGATLTFGRVYDWRFSFTAKVGEVVDC
jgi:hypothetical protein